MSELSAGAFFSLTGYDHANLFAEDAPVWEALRLLKRYLSTQTLGVIESAVPSSVHLVHPEWIRIGKGCRIEPGAYIEGPCILGDACEIRHGAYIRGHVVTGSECVIGHATEIKHSILLNRVCAAHLNYIGDSILGNDVNLGAGTKLANLRLDRSFVPVLFQGRRWETHLKKLGAVIGDGGQLGCNCVTNPGALLGPKSRCSPCLAVSGYVPENAHVKQAQKNVIE
jgi:NDP-sugar pyrophosphorylase family protein